MYDNFCQVTNFFVGPLYNNFRFSANVYVSSQRNEDSDKYVMKLLEHGDSQWRVDVWAHLYQMDSLRR